MAERQPDEEPDRPDQRIADGLVEDYASHFSCTLTPQGVMLFMGTPNTSFDDDGGVSIEEIEYHTKIEMSHESARQLRDVLDQFLGEGAQAR